MLPQHLRVSNTSDRRYLFLSQSRFRVIDLVGLSHCGMVGDVIMTPYDAQLKQVYPERDRSVPKQVGNVR